MDRSNVRRQGLGELSRSPKPACTIRVCHVSCQGNRGEWSHRKALLAAERLQALEKTGLRTIRVHELRHGYGSLLGQSKKSLVYVRDQWDHHSIMVAVDIYEHLAPEGNKAAVDRLDDDFPTTIRNLSATTKEKGVSHVG
jgi:integrase